MAESVTIPRCVWADRPAGDERSANNLHQSKAGAGQRSASCHMLARPEHRCVWPYGGFICRACSKTGEARQILAAGKKAKMEALAQRLNLDTNALAMRVKANASMVAAKATKAAQLAEEADDWWAGTAATAQNLEDALERGKRELKQMDAPAQGPAIPHWREDAGTPARPAQGEAEGARRPLGGAGRELIAAGLSHSVSVSESVEDRNMVLLMQALR